MAARTSATAVIPASDPRRRVPREQNASRAYLIPVLFAGGMFLVLLPPLGVLLLLLALLALLWGVTVPTRESA